MITLKDDNFDVLQQLLSRIAQGFLGAVQVTLLESKWPEIIVFLSCMQAAPEEAVPAEAVPAAGLL